MTDHKDQVTNNQCCICSSQESSQFFKLFDDVFPTQKCKKCDLVYLSRYSPKQLNFFNDSKDNNNEQVEYWSFPKLYKKHHLVFDDFFLQRFNRIEKFKKYNELTSLDIGIGFGFWSKYLTHMGYVGLGIDISDTAIDYCKQQGQSCMKVSLEEFSSPKKYSLISMFDVLEHLENPKNILISLKKNLHNDSLLYIQVPNVLGFKYPFNHSLGLPHHLWQFNPKSLKKLLEVSGYEVMEYWTGIQGVIGHYEAGGPSIMTKLKWLVANFFKIGNRVQIIARVKQ